VEIDYFDKELTRQAQRERGEVQNPNPQDPLEWILRSYSK
jgi:hypothetical protein